MPLGKKACGALLGVAGFLGTLLAVASAEQGAVTHRVTIEKFAFVPAVLTIRPGDSVEWVNKDIVPHTATAEDGSWDTDNLSKEQSALVRFDAPGESTYLCLYHPVMRGEIRVVAE